MNDIVLEDKNLNQLFCDFNKMDVQLKVHRSGINRLSDDDFRTLLTKRFYYKEVMKTLGLMYTYFKWCEEMGM